MLELGTTAPAFALPDTDGRTVSLDSLPQASGFLVVFLCNHCPFVIHVRDELARFSREYGAKGLGMVGINPNDAAAYPADSPQRMAEEKSAVGYAFPYLFDESQEVAKTYRAACTPDFFLFDQNRKLVYRGQFDDSRPDNGKPVTGADLRAAADALLAGAAVPSDQRPSIGCNIKWKPGNAPNYFM
jgi:peroxiredoxin